MPSTNSSAPTSKQMRIFRQVMIEGLPVEQVAHAHRLKPHTIERYVRRVESWLAVQVVTLETLLVANVHLDRLEHQWHELMSAWQRSKQDQVVTKATTDQKENKRVEQTRKTSTGDCRYLEQARRVLADIRTLLGIQQLATPEELFDHADSLTIDERIDHLNQLLQEISEPKTDSPNVRADRGRVDANVLEHVDDRPDAA